MNLLKWLGVALLFLAPIRAVANFPDSTDSTISPPDWMVRGFEAAIADPRPDVASGALLIAGELARAIPPGDRVRVVIERLLPFVDSNDVKVKEAAVKTLATMPAGNQAAVVLDTIRPLLKSDDRGVQSAAAEALAVIPWDGRTAVVVEGLLSLLLGDNSEGREVAINALAKIPAGDRAEAVVDRVLPLLGAGETRLQTVGARALAAMSLGGRSRAVVDGLVSVLRANFADLQITPRNRPDDVAVVIAAIRREVDKARVQAAAVEAVAKIAPGNRGEVVIDALLPLFEPGRAYEREVEIAKLPPRDRLAFLEPLGDLEYERKNVQIALTEALAKLPPGKRAATVVERLLDERTVALRREFPDAAQAMLNLRAAQETDAEVTAMIAADRSFSVETVLSTPKYRADVLTAKNRGFHIGLIYVSLHPPELCSARVTERVLKGGHDVDAGAVVRRYHRSHEQLRWFATHADYLWVFDNSQNQPLIPPTLLATRFPDRPLRLVQRGLNPAVDRALTDLPGVS